MSPKNLASIVFLNKNVNVDKALDDLLGLSMETINGLKLGRALASNMSMQTTSMSSLAPLKVILDQTSHRTFGILKLGTHCALKIRPLDKYVQNIKIEFQYGNQTSHHS